MKEIREKKYNIENLKKMLKSNNSEEIKNNIYHEIAITHFKNGEYDKCMENLKNILDSENNNNIIKIRTIPDYCHVFIKKVNKEKNDNNNNKKSELIKSINTNIESLNNLIEQQLPKDIYYEVHYLKNEYIIY